MPTVLGIKYSVPRILVGGLVCATWLSLSGLLGGYETRQLSLLVRADEECRLDPAWQEETKAVVDAVSRSFDKLFGIRFVIGEFGEWTSPDSVASLEHLAEDLEARSNKGPHDILVALTAQKNLDERYFGYSLFKEGLILIKMMGETRGLVKALEHEMAHLFGAVHVDDPDSLMDIHSRGNRFDDLNARIIRLNRDRTFYGTRFPLPKENWEETAALCRKIASAIQRTDREKKGERGSAARRPNLADVHLLLAQIYLEQAKYEAVMAECKKALRIDPSNLEGLNLYGVALRRSDRIDEAIEKYQEILTRKPGHARVLYNMGIAYGKKGDLEAARDFYLKAVELKPNFAEAYSNLGEIYLRLDKLEEAEACLLKAVSIDPRFALACANLAEVVFREKDYARALELAEKALGFDPGLAGAYTMRGKVYHKDGDIARAKSEFQKAMALDPKDEKACFNLGNCSLDEGRVDEAKALFLRATSLNPRFGEARASLGYCLLLEGRADEAVRELHLALECGYETSNVYLNLSSCYLKKGQFDEAIAAAERALVLNPASSLAHNNLGIAYAQKGMIKEALAEFETALALDPDNKEALLNLGNTYLGLGEMERSLGFYLRVLELDPGSAAVHNNVAVIYFKTGDYRRCREHAERAEALGLRVHPDFWKELKKRINWQNSQCGAGLYRPGFSP